MVNSLLFQYFNTTVIQKKTCSSPTSDLKLKQLPKDVFFKGNDNESNNLLLSKKEFYKQRRKEQQLLKKANDRERARNVGLDPDNFDYNELHRRERAINAGLNPDTATFKEIEHQEELNGLSRRARILHVDIDTKMRIDLIEDIIREAERELDRKITCKGLGLDDNASWDDIHVVLDGIDKAFNQRLVSNLATYSKSHNLNSLYKNDKEDVISLQDINEKCLKIFDAVMEEKISIDDIDEIFENGKYKDILEESGF